MKKKIAFLILIVLLLALFVVCMIRCDQPNYECYGDAPSFNPCEMGCLQVLQKNGVCTNEQIKDINAGLDAAAGQDCLFSYIACNVKNCCTRECNKPCPSSVDPNEDAYKSLGILQNIVYLLDEFPYIAFV